MIFPVCDVCSYCLMPNHFHFLVYATEKTIQYKMVASQERNVLSEGFRNLLSSYTQAINKQENKSGSLFQQNTKSKCLDNGSINYGSVCFHCIHQNPCKSGLVKLMEDWDYSSFKDYTGSRNGTLCNQKLAFELLGMDKGIFYQDSYKAINSDLFDKIL